MFSAPGEDPSCLQCGYVHVRDIAVSLALVAHESANRRGPKMAGELHLVPKDKGGGARARRAEALWNEGLTYREIAEAMGVKRNTVSKLIMRARQA